MKAKLPTLLLISPHLSLSVKTTTLEVKIRENLELIEEKKEVQKSVAEDMQVVIKERLSMSKDRIQLEKKIEENKKERKEDASHLLFLCIFPCCFTTRRHNQTLS